MSSKGAGAAMGEQDQQSGLVPKLRFPEFRGDDQWQLKPFKKLFTIGNGRDYKHLSNGDVPVYGSGGYMLSVNDYLYNGESVCIGRKGTIDNPIFLTGKFWTVDTLFYTHKFQDCLPKFIFFVFQNINWRNHNEAGGVPSLSKTNIEKIEVAVPKTDEQQKIADCLSSIDALIAAEAGVLDAMKDHKRGLMQQLFPAPGETTPRLRFPEFQDRGEWEERPLGEIASYQNGKAYEPHIVENGRYIVVNARFISTDGVVKKWSNNPQLIAEEDDILMVLSDLPNGRALAKCYRVREENKYAVNQRIVRLTPHAVRSDFLFPVLNRHPYLLGFNDGMNQTHLSKNDVLTCPILLPTNENEQIAIADCLSSVDAQIATQVDRLKALKAHKGGLMQQLFPVADEVQE
jgi:type I restriction enzyme, S subunit